MPPALCLHQSRLLISTAAEGPNLRSAGPLAPRGLGQGDSGFGV